jgi:hypothetical protein
MVEKWLKVSMAVPMVMLSIPPHRCDKFLPQEALKERYYRSESDYWEIEYEEEES